MGKASKIIGCHHEADVPIIGNRTAGDEYARSGENAWLHIETFDYAPGRTVE